MNDTSTASIYFLVTNSLISGFLGTIIGAILSYIAVIKSTRTEKKFFVELEIISKSIISPLIEKYLWINKREIENLASGGITIQQIIPQNTYWEIEQILGSNICWLYATNKKLQRILFQIYNHSKEKNEKLIIVELENLYNEIQNKMKKYKT